MTTKSPKTFYSMIHQCWWFSDTAAPCRSTAAVLQCQVVGTWPSRCFLIANHPGIESEYQMSITCPAFAAFPHLQSSTHKLHHSLFRSKAPLPAWACNSNPKHRDFIFEIIFDIYIYIYYYCLLQCQLASDAPQHLSPPKKVQASLKRASGGVCCLIIVRSRYLTSWQGRMG